VGLFRRKQETLNEQLLREAGLDPAQVLEDSSPPPAPEPLEPPRSGLARAGVADGSGVGPKEWDAAVTVTAPGLAGDSVEFTTIPNGDVIVSKETGDSDLSPLADAVERRVDPPYRAVAARQEGDLWAVGARRIQVAKVPFPVGDKLELSFNGTYGEFRVDGEQSEALVPPELEELGTAAGASFFVTALRIDGDLWEVRATGL
jgi:hypothetical protein